MSETLDRLVIQVNVRHLDIMLWNGIEVDAEAVVLRSDFDLFRFQILNGLVPAVMTGRIGALGVRIIMNRVPSRMSAEKGTSRIWSPMMFSLISRLV